jgi:hypothetical protein
MPLVLDFMMCEIIDISKDSKPTKKEIEKKLQYIVKMPIYLGDAISLD